MSQFSNFCRDVPPTFVSSKMFNQKNSKTMEKFISWVEIPAVDMNRAVNFYNALLRLDLNRIILADIILMDIKSDPVRKKGYMAKMAKLFLKQFDEYNIKSSVLCNNTDNYIKI